MSIGKGKKAVVLLSGGVDSSTTLAIASSEGYEIYAISFAYGQRHDIELECAKKVADSLGVSRHLVVKFDLGLMGGSALTSEIEVPKDRHAGEGNLAGVIPVTYVPARNTIFLSFALSWAETLMAGDIFMGANAIDYSGYPDCRPEYIKAFEEMANLATKVAVEGTLKFRIHTPLISMTKAEIIKKGHELGLDYGLTWSCYDPVEVKNEDREENVYRPCGGCDSCRIRAEGFRKAGLRDPLAG
jgi:7-cyano-7-deazaguanine synthase